MANVTQEAVKYDVCFIQAGNSPDDATEILKLAFEAMDSNQMEPVWITVADCLKLTKKEPKLFIIDPFEGEAFEHLKSIHCRIVGPLCVLYCLQYTDFLPKRSYPIYSVSMRKITVSCSNIQAKMREDISTKVQLMGGFFSKDLTKSVTHLVVGEVGSQKYKVAANFGLPIMVPDWITDVWENGQYKQLHASDSCYDRHKCPVFKGLVITVSQLSAEERLVIKTVIEDNGGAYSGALKANETTHLVLNEPTGDKYRFAKNWKVICVNVNWIYDSVDAGYCRDETLYGVDESIKSQPKRSTPKKDLTSCDLPLVDCSVIAGNPAVSHLDETMRSEVSIPLSNRKSIYSTLDEFNMSSLPKYGQFLDGCKIFLTGFSAVHLDKLRKIVNSGSGMRFSKYSDSISHVVCGDLSDEILQNIRASSVKPYVVNYKWLLECCKNEKLVDEKQFLCMDVTTLSPEKNEVKEIKNDISLRMSQNNSQTKKEDFANDNMMDIFKQYINEQQLEDDKENSKNKPNNLSAKTLESAKNMPNTINIKLNNEFTVSNVPVIDLEKEVDNLKEYPLAEKEEDIEDDVENEENSENLFLGLKFVVIGFGQKDLELLSGMIEGHSGTILKEVNSSCDIAIVPLIWRDFNIPVSNIVTNCWLQKCIEDSRIYDFDENELFRPFDISADKKPFESFVISFSQYGGTERDCLIYLSEYLGATCQEYFVRRANAAKGVLSNTHLVVSTPDGSKYEASKKWKIPAVTKRWVTDAAKMGIVPDINEYLTEKFPEFPTGTEEIKTAGNNSESTKSEKKTTSCNLDKPVSNINVLQKDQSIALHNESRLEDVGKSSTSRPCAENVIDTEVSDCTKKVSQTPKVLSEVPCVPLQHSRIAELCNESINKLSPLKPGLDNSLNASLNLDQTHNFKFHVSGLLKDLDASVSRESLGGGRKSLPVEEMFSRNLASALRRIDEKTDSEKEVDNKIKKQRNSTSEKSNILSGVVLYVSRKLANVQIELNETVVLLGGDYIWTYDNTCTHFVFVGKPNDITREFREARAQGKKIVSPEWVYACREKGIRIEEDLYPHTYKANMTLSQQISILKAPLLTSDGPEENKPRDQQEIEEEPPKDADKLLKSEETPDKSKEADFNKQLNELLVAAKSAKKRQSKRIGGSVSSSPVSDISPVQKLQRHLSDVYIRPTSTANPTEEPPDTGSQHSQAYPITWDDPTGRLEREKIAARAAKIAENTTVGNNPKTEENIEVIDIALTPVEMNNTKKKFMFTNISDALKSEYESKVKKLGGEVSDEKTFDMTASHLILSNPIKNEKFLSSVASGKWVLHPEYILVSMEHNKFVEEEEYEWGGPSSDRFNKNISSSNAKIARCPYRWRSKLQQGLVSSGAFDSWKVIIHADDKAKLATYTKILESGGAEIIPSDTSESDLDRVSHVFVDVRKRSPNKVDLSCYISRNIKCIKPEYLAFYLIEDSPPDIDNFLVPEAKEQLGSSTSSKRRNLSSSSRQSKRTRLK